MDISVIQKRINILEKHEEEIKNAKELLKGELENSPEYQEAIEEAKASQDKKKRIKDEILGRGPNLKLVQTIKENSEEISTLKEILSAELIQVFQENNTDIFTDADGGVRKFKLTGKLLPKKGSYQDRDYEGKFKE